MNFGRSSAASGSVAVGGNNSGVIANLAQGASLSLNISHQVERRLPSHLGRIIAHVASDGIISRMNTTPQQIPPEVEEKLSLNKISVRHPIVTTCTKHLAVLESAYKGAEKYNSEVRILVKMRAGCIYMDCLLELASTENIKDCDLSKYACINSIHLVKAVVDRLISEYCASDTNELVEQESAMLAVRLIVADAIVACEVLQKP